ncbi:cobyric acid synthase [Halocynthiibacter namhaensis]|uniref:cobyric acid synthase n=1 Tax=Halocynthiibacter namhaensis TaxID=1290553 RepID=UPI0005798DEB|nr:cobyric acid synthase [Halocynthiibacter namhaensis]
MSKAVMIQGAGSNVGKSMLVAGLCRAAKRRGLTVAPFKPQNMSNNAAVTSDGGEIGRAQALQAMACGLEPHTDMNPILLKPETDTGAQVVVQGKRLTTTRARDYARLKSSLMASVLDSFNRLKSQYDLVIVEGAGSPAEVNLRANDIANMGFACAADVPVILAGDIDRGGVIAQILGTQLVLPDEDNAMIAGFLINKFRGDVSLFDDGYKLITERSNWPGFGVLPFFKDAVKLPAEDALDLPTETRGGGYKIVCLGLSRIANFDDLDPLGLDENIALRMLKPGEVLPADTDLVIIPGSKSTRGDLEFLRQQGWDIDLLAHVRRGGHVLGICGGYQMLGKVIRDPDGIEGAAGETPGLGLLDVETIMTSDKHLTRITGQHSQTGTPIEGYEIHIGRTEGPDRIRPFAHIDGQAEGAISENGQVMGSYLHGLFSADDFRGAFLNALGAQASTFAYGSMVDETLDALADHMETHLDVAGLLRLAR